MWLSKQWKTFLSFFFLCFYITELSRKSMPAKWCIDSLCCLKEKQRNGGVRVSGKVRQETEEGSDWESEDLCVAFRASQADNKAATPR